MEGKGHSNYRRRSEDRGAMARLFASEGATVALLDLTESQRPAVADGILRESAEAMSIPADVRSQADVYGEPIHRTMADEGPAYGAALLGGIAAGIYRHVNEACSTGRLREEVTAPDPEQTGTHEEHYEVYRSLYPSMWSAMHRLTELATTGDYVETTNARRNLKA